VQITVRAKDKEEDERGEKEEDGKAEKEEEGKVEKRGRLCIPKMMRRRILQEPTTLQQGDTSVHTKGT
jgi:hypothetical protein